jgi:hypothetical protein
MPLTDGFRQGGKLAKAAGEIIAGFAIGRMAQWPILSNPAIAAGRPESSH